MTIYILIGVYILSAVGMWCFYHFYENEVDTGFPDIFITIFPGVNTTMLFNAIIYMIGNNNWQTISKKFFGL